MMCTLDFYFVLWILLMQMQNKIYFQDVSEMEMFSEDYKLANDWACKWATVGISEFSVNSIVDS